jgi:hypothetical protein
LAKRFDSNGGLDMLAIDPQSADQVFAEYGLKVSARQCAEEKPLAIAADLCDAASLIMTAMQDGRMDHRETASLATRFRDMIPEMQAVVDRDNATRTPK